MILKFVSIGDKVYVVNFDKVFYFSAECIDVKLFRVVIKNDFNGAAFEFKIYENELERTMSYVDAEIQKQTLIKF